MNSGRKSDKFWEKIESDDRLVKNALDLANRDLKTAENLFKDRDYDWAFAVCYNSLLQAGRALMFSEGFRPKGEYKHVSVVEFVRQKFGNEFADRVLFTFNKTRKKRHTVVYEQIRIISRNEAENALKAAKEFLEKASELLERKQKTDEKEEKAPEKKEK